MDWTDRLFGFKTGANTLAYAIEYAESGFNLRTDFSRTKKHSLRFEVVAYL